MGLEEIEEIVKEISNGIEQYCQCNFPRDYIIDTKFICDKDTPEYVTFQGRIIGTDERDSADLVEQLNRWTSNKPTVVIQGAQVQVVISEDPVHDEQLEDNTGIAIGLSVAAITVLLVLIAIAIASIIYWKRRHTRYDFCHYGNLRSQVTYMRHT